MKVFSKSDIGLVRSENQDSFRTAELSDGSVFCVVCDGMGGPAGGRIASDKAAEQIYKTVTSCYRPEMRSTGVVNLLRSASVNANAVVYDAASSDPALSGMGTTAVAALIIRDELYVSNVGDSRCYIVSAYGIRQITKDHSLVQELVDSGKLSPEKAESHPNKNIITRAVGVDSDVDVDIIIEDISEGEVVLLCTDGLSNFADNREIYDTIMKEDNPDPAEALIEKALENGGGDNVTAAVIVL